MLVLPDCYRSHLVTRIVSANILNTGMGPDTLTGWTLSPSTRESMQ